MATPPPDLNTAVFPGFSMDDIHLYFTLAKEGLISESVSPTVSGAVTQPTSDKPIGQESRQKHVSLRAEGG